MIPGIPTGVLLWCKTGEHLMDRIERLSTARAAEPLELTAAVPVDSTDWRRDQRLLGRQVIGLPVRVAEGAVQACLQRAARVLLDLGRRR